MRSVWNLEVDKRGKVVKASVESDREYKVVKPYKLEEKMGNWRLVSGEYSKRWLKTLEKRGLISWY